MTDTSKCFSLLRGRALRSTKLDGCGGVVLGPDSQVTTTGFITVALTANTDEGTTVQVQNAAGENCILDTPAPKFLNYGVEIAYCGVNPDLIAQQTGQATVVDDDGLAVGFGVDDDVDASASGFAIEMWSTVPTAACAPGETAAYGYFLLPFLQGGVLGDFTVANDAINFTLSGAVTKSGNHWGTGPYNVVDDGSGNAVDLLTAIPTTRHLHVQYTTIAPPDTSACGTGQVGVPTTLITAGIPATLTPANSYAPASLANLISLAPAKTPTTAWTTGQYVLLRDGSKAHWNSTTWIAGPA